MKAFKVNIRKKASVPLFAKACFKNKKTTRRQLLLQNGNMAIGFKKPFKGKTIYE